MERRPRQDCRESLDAGGIGSDTLEINWGGQQWTTTGSYDDDHDEFPKSLIACSNETYLTTKAIFSSSPQKYKFMIL